MSNETQTPADSKCACPSIEECFSSREEREWTCDICLAKAATPPRPEADTRMREIRERCERATPGPWKGDEFEMTAPKAEASPGKVKLVWADDYHMNEWAAEFVKHAREDVPYLLTRVEELEAENARLKSTYDGETDWHAHAWKLQLKLQDAEQVLDQLECDCAFANHENGLMSDVICTRCECLQRIRSS